MMTASMVIGGWLAIGAVVTAYCFEDEMGGWGWSIILWPLVLLSKVLP